MKDAIKRSKKDLSPEQRKELLEALKSRFEENISRHWAVGSPHRGPLC
jgi:hypothetical protein